MFPVPEKVTKFYHVNDVKCFQHDRPVYKGQVDEKDSNDFSRLWIERTILAISEPLPNILRWTQIIDRSFQELTPVEFACETMENVTKELYELNNEYRANPKRNLNPFTMRLQGIIDANVNGGIKNYFAFFTEGKSQQANVQRLKQLMLKQVQILEVCMELHASLAPEQVQPLHKRLFERFTQMKQNIHSNKVFKIKRQFSDVLPPLPAGGETHGGEWSPQKSSIEDNKDSSDGLIDDHSNYHMMNFEKEEIYTRPSSKLNGNCEVKPSSQMQRCISTRDQNYLTRADSYYTAPPLPIRPKSAGYGNYDSPEIPPKATNILAPPPPLPPRDKRISNPLLNNSLNYCSIEYQENDLSASMVKSPHQKYSIVNIPLEDQFVEADRFKSTEDQIEFRDSGISTTSHDLNYAYICNDGKRIVASTAGENGDEQIKNPPPIPRKMINSVNNGINHSNLKDESSDQSIDKCDHEP